MALLSSGLWLAFLLLLFQNSSSRTEKDEQKRLEQGNARLIYSILHGHADLMKQALDEGASVNAPVDPFLVETILKLGQAFHEFPVVPPLHFAMNYGKRAQLNMGSMLLRAHADPNRYALSPADLATTNSASKDAATKSTDSSSQGKPVTPTTPFHRGYAPAALYALGFGQEAGNSHAAVLQRLFREYPDRFNLTVLDEWRRLTGNPPLTHLMIYWQNFDGLYFVVSEWTKDVNERAYAPPRLAAASASASASSSASTALQQQQQLYRSLLPRSASEWVDWSIDPYGLTPLHLAAWFGDVAATVFLLHNGADLFARSHFYGHFPIHLAIFRHHSAIVSLHLAYAIERKRDPEDAWRTLIQLAAPAAADFDLVFRTYTRWLHTNDRSPSSATATAAAAAGAAAAGAAATCPRSPGSSASSSSSQAAPATGSAPASVSPPPRDTIDFLLLQPRLYAAVPVVHNLSQQHHWPIQPAPPVAHGPAGGLHQGHRLQKQLSWDFVVDKLQRERHNEAQLYDDPAAAAADDDDRFTTSSSSSSPRRLSDSCLLPRSIDVVAAPQLTARRYRDEYYTLQRPVLVTDAPAQRVGIWANVPAPSSATADAASAAATAAVASVWEAQLRVREAQAWQDFREVFVARFQSYPVHVYRSRARADALSEELTFSADAWASYQVNGDRSGGGSGSGGGGGGGGGGGDSDNDESEHRYRYLAAQFNHSDALARTMAARFTTPERVPLAAYVASLPTTTTSAASGGGGGGSGSRRVLAAAADVAEAMVSRDRYQDDFFTEMPYPTSPDATPPTPPSPPPLADQCPDEDENTAEAAEEAEAEEEAHPLASLFVPICHSATETTRRRLFPRLAALRAAQPAAPQPPPPPVEASSAASPASSSSDETRRRSAEQTAASDDDNDSDSDQAATQAATQASTQAKAPGSSTLPPHLRHLRHRPRSSSSSGATSAAATAQWPHLLAPHPFYEPFRLVVTPAPVQPAVVRVAPAASTAASTAAKTAATDGDAAAVPAAAAAATTAEAPPLRVDEVARVLLTTGASFLQQYTQTGYAPPRVVVPDSYRDTLRNRSSVATASPVSGPHRFGTAHYDLLVHGPAKRWILLPPGQWLLVNRTLALPETAAWLRRQLEGHTRTVKDLERRCRQQEQRQRHQRQGQAAGSSWAPWCAALRDTADVLTTLMPPSSSSSAQPAMPPLELWDHHQLRWLLVPWLRRHCVGIVDPPRLVQRVGDVVVVPHDYFYFYYHDPGDDLPATPTGTATGPRKTPSPSPPPPQPQPQSPSDTKRSTVPSSSGGRQTRPPSAASRMSHPVTDTAAATADVDAAAAVEAGADEDAAVWHTTLLTRPPSVSVTQSFCTWFDTDTHTQSLGFVLYGHRHPSPRTHGRQRNDTRWLLDDSWRGRVGEAPRRSAQVHRDTPEHRYPVRPHHAPIFDWPTA